MKQFPDLHNWFNISEYYEHNKCRTITLLWKKDLKEDDVQRFIVEFAKLICRLRCNGELILEDNGEDLCYKFQQAIDNKIELEKEEKERLAKYIFFDGMISQSKYNKTKNYIESLDREAFNGYFGEVLFYIVREQCLEDEKVIIEPSCPKTYSKQPGLDYVEIRKCDSDYYFIIGEVKTTDDTIDDYPDKILDSLIERPVHLIHQTINAFKERTKYSAPEDLKKFINRMPIYFMNKNPTKHKRFAGVINYGRNSPPRKTVFQNFRAKCVTHLYDSSECRRIKLIGIKGMKDIKERVLEVIWTKLSI
ncbi:hypothetical protein [Herbinix hemicellulosilytica]|uniref:Anti-bacteriophage protein A/HamA C-terminal domain-containing protein n=1 Tax=Herbinix hemicellulosilytica TaxID=1564487 RepID=A0A0H5SM53_HERHM|nr:hypothetical protein [Herbinix hemicellulosilytica]CRZ35886.1 hypothetical protein HHT355_2705 [Herbinix hemicellulosilytica]